MFSLIITIISIALVAALAIATLYYGGSAFTEGNTRATASAIVNQAQQIGGAATLYSVQNAMHPADVDALEGAYLSSLPTPPAGTTGPWALYTTTTAVDGIDGVRVVQLPTVASADVCEAINVQAGATTPAAVANIGSLPYGCVQELDEGDFVSGKFQYRY
jgi:hypothetical protein